MMISILVLRSAGVAERGAEAEVAERGVEVEVEVGPALGSAEAALVPSACRVLADQDSVVRSPDRLFVAHRSVSPDRLFVARRSASPVRLFGARRSASPDRQFVAS